MLAVKSLSITPGNNTSNSEEDQDPGTVNDGIRDLKAGIATDYRDRQWTEYGRGDGAGTGGTDYSCTFATATTLYVGPGNLVTPYHVGRAVRVTGPTTGTLYGTITSSAHDVSGDATLVTMALDGNIVNETGIRIWVSTLEADGKALPIAAVNGRSIDMDFEILRNPSLENYMEERETLAIASGAVAWDINSTGNVAYLKLTENVTSITLTDWAPNPKCGSATLVIQQDGTGGWNVSGWPAAIVWFGGSAPVITTTANAVDAIVLMTLDGGAHIIGNAVQGALFSAAIG